MADSPTVLLVHAHPAQAATLAAELDAAGYLVMGPVSSGLEAVAACTRVLPDIAVVQQALPGDLSCEQLALQLGRLGPVPSVVLMDDEAPEALERLVAAFPLALVPRGATAAERLAIIRVARRQAGALRTARDPDARFFSVAIDLLCFLDFNGYFRRLSPQWERTLGWTLEELTSRPFIEFVHPDDRERTMAQNRSVRGGGQALGFENRYLCKDGSFRWFRWNAAADRDHHVIYSVARDVTDQKRIAAEREALIAELQQALAEVKTLREIIPICSYCKKVRDDHDYWQHVEAYIADHTGAQFSHGVCPTCYEQVLASEVPERR